MSVDQYYSMAIPSFRLQLVYRLKLTNTNEYAEFYELKNCFNNQRL